MFNLSICSFIHSLFRCFQRTRFSFGISIFINMYIFVLALERYQIYQYSYSTNKTKDKGQEKEQNEYLLYWLKASLLRKQCAPELLYLLSSCGILQIYLLRWLYFHYAQSFWLKSILWTCHRAGFCLFAFNQLEHLFCFGNCYGT